MLFFLLLVNLWQVEQIQMITFGDHYTSQPTIDLTHSGDGTATAAALFIGGQFQYAGYYLNEDGQLSSRRFLQDAVIYNNYTYNITSRALVTAYYNLVYQILNPAANMRGITQIDISTGQQDITATTGIFITTTPHVNYLNINFVLNISELS